MHADDWPVEASMVQSLIATQFPQWANRRLDRLASSGSSNVLFRLGDELCVRLPRNPWAAEQLAKEQAWLPELAGRTTLSVPRQLAVGKPVDVFPHPWSILRWLDGEPLSGTEPFEELESAERLAEFIGELEDIDPAGGPAPGRHNVSRGAPLARWDRDTRAGISAMEGLIDTGLAASLWDDTLAAPEWDRPGVWIHGDLQTSNLLLVNGPIGGVIDFGCLGVGDPAYDLLPAWTVFGAVGRERFRSALDVDEATWRRGQGWALSFGVMVFSYFRTTNPGLATTARRTVDRVLDDARRR